MKIYTYTDLLNKLNDIEDEEEIYQKICRNIKRVRLIRYHEFKEKAEPSAINPYTSENIASLLGYSHTHYKRFESENDKTIKIPLIRIIQLLLILDIPFEELLK